MSCANLKVVVLFLSEISSRGAKVPLKMNENIIKFKALPIFLPEGDSWGFSICHSWYLAEQNDTKKALILIFPGFDQTSEFTSLTYKLCVACTLFIRAVSPPFGEEPWCSEWFKQLGSLQYVRCRHRSVNCERPRSNNFNKAFNNKFVYFFTKNAGSYGILLWIATSQDITCKFTSYDSINIYRLYPGYVLFNAVSLIHVLRSDTFKAERIIGRFEHNSLERLAAASGFMSSL